MRNIGYYLKLDGCQKPITVLSLMLYLKLVKRYYIMILFKQFYWLSCCHLTFRKIWYCLIKTRIDLVSLSLSFSFNVIKQYYLNIFIGFFLVVALGYGEWRHFSRFPCKTSCASIDHTVTDGTQLWHPQQRL
jgi:hypothetical protein